jgi:hypothetical protein
MRILLLVLLLATSASAQQPAWDLTGVHQPTQPISQLNPPDRHAILKRLQIADSQLHGEQLAFGKDPAFAIQGLGPILCGATGNCEFWVFDAAHQILLETSAQGFKLLPETHSGRPDLLTTMHDSAFEADAARWQFDGRRYRQSSCATIDFGDPYGKTYPQPRVTPHPCE